MNVVGCSFDKNYTYQILLVVIRVLLRIYKMAVKCVIKHKGVVQRGPMLFYPKMKLLSNKCEVDLMQR